MGKFMVEALMVELSRGAVAADGGDGGANAAATTHASFAARNTPRRPFAHRGQTSSCTAAPPLTDISATRKKYVHDLNMLVLRGASLKLLLVGILVRNINVNSLCLR